MWTFSAIHCSLEMESEQDKHAKLVLLISDDKMAKGWATHWDEHKNTFLQESVKFCEEFWSKNTEY